MGQGSRVREAVKSLPGPSGLHFKESLALIALGLHPHRPLYDLPNCPAQPENLNASSRITALLPKIGLTLFPPDKRYITAVKIYSFIDVFVPDLGYIR